MQKIFEVQFKAYDVEKKFPFIDIGNEIHDKPSLRVWLSTHLTYEIEGNHYTMFPLEDATINITDKQNFVIKPELGEIVQYLYVPCGFMGNSKIEILSPIISRINFNMFSFPEGITGVSNGCLVNLPKFKTLKYHWKRSGELYGQQGEGIKLVRQDGTEEARCYSI